MMEVSTKFNVLNEELSLQYDRNPIETIKTRIKSVDSIVEKLRRQNYPLNLTNIEEKLAILRDADAIFREEMKLAGLDRTTSQFFAVLTDLRSVGVMGDERTYDYTLALRAVQSQDFMTATWSRLPYELLDKVSNRIVGEVKHINRICYDITSKPPATVEWVEKSP